MRMDTFITRLRYSITLVDEILDLSRKDIDDEELGFLVRRKIKESRQDWNLIG